MNELLTLLMEIDEYGEDLKPTEVEFVAGLIDHDITEFTPEQEAGIRRIHRKRVTTGRSD